MHRHGREVLRGLRGYLAMLAVVCILLWAGVWAAAAVGAHNHRYRRRSAAADRTGARDGDELMAMRRRLSTQILASQLTIMVAALLVGFGLFAHEERGHLDQQYRQRALAIAWTVAGIPVIREAMEYGDSGVVQSTAERVRVQSGAAYIVVIDMNRVRHSHPTQALIGQAVEEPLIARDGKAHTELDHGSLGPSANGKVPLYGPSGNLVGEVSVGILESDVDAALYRELPAFALYAGIALAAGLVASLLLARRLKRTTFGLELHEFATLLQEREAMLHGIREGVLGFDAAGRMTVANDEARRLLGLGTGGIGQPLSELLPPGRLRDVLSGEAPGPDETVLTDAHCLTVNRMPVRLKGRELGAVVTLRDRTELVEVLRELDSVRGLSDALRAQQHEFANRMHTVAGLIELGDPAQAVAFIAETEAAQAGEAESIRERIGSPLVAALVLAKHTVAAERGVRLDLSADSWLSGPSHPGADQDQSRVLVTVLGNLLDNAIDAAAAGGSLRRVALSLFDDDRGVTISVRDSGHGIPVESLESIFQDGYTTKEPRGQLRRGLGLALVHRVVSQAGGTVDVRTGPGATFTVRLPAAVVEPTP
jgi:two-component system CitB family sensor kinase